MFPLAWKAENWQIYKMEAIRKCDGEKQEMTS